MSGTERLKRLPADPRREDLAMRWDREASKAEQDKQGKADNNGGIKEFLLIFAGGLACIASFFKSKACAWVACISFCSFASYASQLSDVKNLIHIGLFSLLGLFMCYFKPIMERKATLQEVFAIIQTLNEAGETDFVPAVQKELRRILEMGGDMVRVGEL